MRRPRVEGEREGVLTPAGAVIASWAPRSILGAEVFRFLFPRV
jgi:hypothetical protein